MSRHRVHLRTELRFADTAGPSVGAVRASDTWLLFVWCLGFARPETQGLVVFSLE